jgi:hypothetical protein
VLGTRDMPPTTLDQLRRVLGQGFFFREVGLRFCFFGKRYYECNWLLGARPQTPRVGFAEVRANKYIPRGGTHFLFFVEKEEYYKMN